MGHDLPAEIDEVRARQVALAVIGAPAADFEIGGTEPVADVIDGRQDGKSRLKGKASGCGLLSLVQGSDLDAKNSHRAGIGTPQYLDAVGSSTHDQRLLLAFQGQRLGLKLGQFSGPFKTPGGPGTRWISPSSDPMPMKAVHNSVARLGELYCVAYTT
jgi:hypothetical protein